jgi:hypothetical protein
MPAMTVEQALENIYSSIQNDNEDLDIHIAALKEALVPTGKKEVVVDPARLPQPNREGRKLMQSYFRKRGISVSFASQG